MKREGKNGGRETGREGNVSGGKKKRSGLMTCWVEVLEKERKLMDLCIFKLNICSLMSSEVN